MLVAAWETTVDDLDNYYGFAGAPAALAFTGPNVGFFNTYVGEDPTMQRCCQALHDPALMEQLLQRVLVTGDGNSTGPELMLLRQVAGHVLQRVPRGKEDYAVPTLAKPCDLRKRGASYAIRMTISTAPSAYGTTSRTY